MKVRISYFYQIRFFKPNMIPVSTAMSDPKYYHNFNNSATVFKDKNGVWNGLRYLKLVPGEDCNGLCTGQPCNETYQTCPFLSNYRKQLNKIDFNKMMQDFNNVAEQVRQKNNISEDEEMIIVLIVYEKPDNPCSERRPLIELFNNNGIECKELKYPIK